MHTWGFDVKLGADTLRSLERLLWSAATPGGGPKLTTRNKRPSAVVVDFVACVRTHVVACLAKHYGQPYLDMAPIEWLFVVPPVWKSSRG